MDGFLPLLPGQLRTEHARWSTVDTAARRVGLSSGESIGYQNLVVTTALPELVQMLGEWAPAGVRESAQALRCDGLALRAPRRATGGSHRQTSGLNFPSAGHEWGDSLQSRHRADDGERGVQPAGCVWIHLRDAVFAGTATVMHG